MKERAQMKGRTVGLPLNGGNIDLPLFRDWILSGAG
jgi:threonine dehydratase